MSRHRVRCVMMFVCVAALLSLAACTRPDSGMAIPAPVQHQQIFQLQGRIQQGPSSGLNFSGELRTESAAGRYLKGLLIRENGSPVTVTGQLDGLAIHLSFDLGNDEAVLGVGTLQHTIDNPHGTVGGLLTGPQPDDTGNWFGSWQTITLLTTPTPPSAASNTNTTDANTSSLLGLTALIVVALLLMVALVQKPLRSKTLYSRSSGRSGVPFVKASAQTVEPEPWPDEATLPLAQFATTYAHGDDHYDLSFTINSARGEFLGECGAGISAALDPSGDSATPAWLEPLATTGASGRHKAVTALEVWIFDKHDINTVTKVLRAAQGRYQDTPRSRRDRVSEVLVIEPDHVIVLETKSLRLRVKVMAVEYLYDTSGSASIFQRVSLKLAVWAKGQASA